LSPGAEKVHLITAKEIRSFALSRTGEAATAARCAQNEYEQGFTDGRARAEEEFERELESRIARERDQLFSLLDAIQTQYASFQQKAERTSIELAVAIAELILKRELATDREAVIRQIHEALKRVLGVERIKLRVNPEDEQLVRDRRSEILAESDSIREMVIEPDEAISRGGCIVESESGNVDALVSTQLHKIEEALLEECGGSS
jgi:flagellar assembly protein FliH